MGLAEAREACRKASERIDGGVMPATPAPHPRSPDALTLGSLLDRYETMRTQGRPADQGAAQGDAAAAAAPETLAGLAGRRVHQGRSAHDARQADRRRHRHRGKPHARLARAGDALGERGRSDPDQYRAGYQAHAGDKARARADQAGNQGDLARLRKARSARGGDELRPHGAVPAGHARNGATRPPR